MAGGGAKKYKEYGKDKKKRSAVYKKFGGACRRVEIKKIKNHK